MAEIRIRRVAVLAGVVIVPLLAWLIFELATESEAEKIGKMLDQMASAAQAGDPDGMVRFLASDYLHEGLTRQDLRAAAEAYFKEFGSTEVRVAAKQITISALRAYSAEAASAAKAGSASQSASQRALASAYVTVVVRPQGGEMAGAFVTTRWQFSLANRRIAGAAGPEWQIVRASLTSIGRVQLEDWGPVMRRLGIRPSRSPAEEKAG
jgi:hypothetical protein